MYRTPWYAAVILAGILVVAVSPGRAQEEPPPAEPPEAPPAPTASTDAGKPPWWGGKNSLYVEIGYGSASFDEIETSVSTESGNYSRNRYNIDSSTAGRFAIGWALPDDRGRFLISFEGVKEDGYKFDAVGEQSTVVGGSSSAAPHNPLPWWYVSVRDGQLSTYQTPPIWNPTSSGPDCGVGCDRNSDGRPSLDEIYYSPVRSQEASISVPKSLNNNLKTYDFLFAREFGGRRIWGDWSAGGRYFTSNGAVPVSAWLVIVAGSSGEGYTDGVTYRLLRFRQETSGIGPTTSLGVNFGFLRRKLVLHAGARVSYVLSSLETNTGDFFTLISDSGGGFVTAPANLSQKLDKSVWQLQAQASARWEVATGVNLIAEYRRSGFQDAIFIPVSLSIPDVQAQASQGTVAVYGTRDFRFQTITAGVSYQF